MPNENSLKNLEKGASHRFKAGDEQAKPIQSKGGRKSQQVQKEKRDAASYAKMVMSLSPKMPAAVERQVQELGIKTKKPDAKLIAICAQMRKAMAGDKSALEFLLEITGENMTGAPQQEDQLESMDDQRIRSKLDSMTDDQLRSYQELCSMFASEEREGEADE